MRRIAVLLTLFSLMITCSGCQAPDDKTGEGTDKEIYTKTIAEAAAINRESNLGVVFLAQSDLSESEAKNYGPDHPELTFSEDGDVTGYFFNYPWDSNERRLTQILIESEDYDFYGIKVGDDISDVKPIVEELGYTLKDNLHVYANTLTETYTKYHVYLAFITGQDDPKILSILVSIEDPSQPEVVM